MNNQPTFVLACLIALSLPGSPGLNAADSKPNVLFLAVDDMNDWIGCLGTTPHAITPNIDRLAARGVSFTNAHTAGVFCAPSRATIFSGSMRQRPAAIQPPTILSDTLKSKRSK